LQIGTHRFDVHGEHARVIIYTFTWWGVSNVDRSGGVGCCVVVESEIEVVRHKI
jgi:hypothetical protein